MTGQRRISHSALLAATLSIGATGASAQGWEFTGAIYGWGPGTAVDVATPAGEVSGELSFADAWEALDLAFMGIVTAENGRFGFILDTVFLKLSDDRATPGALGFSGAALTSDIRLINAYAAWQVLATSGGRLDAVAGARFYDTESTVTLTGGPGPVGAVVSDNWVDPVIGLRYRAEFRSDWYATLFADVGGFGTGSEFTWQGVALVGYRFTDNFSIEGGYRVLQSDRIEANGEIDITMSGPLIGARWRF